MPTDAALTAAVNILNHEDIHTASASRLAHHIAEAIDAARREGRLETMSQAREVAIRYFDGWHDPSEFLLDLNECAAEGEKAQGGMTTASTLTEFMTGGKYRERCLCGGVTKPALLRSEQRWVCLACGQVYGEKAQGG